MIIFWILFVWLPLAIYVKRFCVDNISNFGVQFDIRDEIELLLFLLVPPRAVIVAVIMLDDCIWGKK